MKCPNCNAPIERIDGFCWNCGQKNKDGRITLREFFKDVLENVLNIDAKIFRTIGHLFIPAKLSNRYFQGQRQQYFSPFRIFFFTGLIFFTLLSFFSAREINEEESSDDQIQRIGHWEAFLHEIDTAKDFTLENFPDVKELPAALDTFYAQLPDYGNDNRYIEFFYLDDQWNIKQRKVTLTYEELANKTTEELIEIHQVEGWIGKAIFGQMIKLTTDSKSFILFMLKNLLWMTLVMMAALAFILKLLYIRRHRFLIEHLVFAFHYHSFAFILFSIGSIIGEWRDSQAWLGWASLFTFIYLFIAMRRFYLQGWFKTFIKFCILNFSYLFIFIISIALTFVVSVFIF